MKKLIVGKTDICIVRNCGKQAIKWDGFLVKSRDAVSAGFCEHHWFHTQCPNFGGIKNCYGTYDKSLNISTIDEGNL